MLWDFLKANYQKYKTTLKCSKSNYALFSAYYIVFLSFDNPNTPEGIDDSISNPMPSPMESILAMFLMSMTNFGDYYTAFDRTDHEVEAKVYNLNYLKKISTIKLLSIYTTLHILLIFQLLFVIYMAIVAILLVNMLIAMMGNTYQKIAETRNEWQRQVSIKYSIVNTSSIYWYYKLWLLWHSRRILISISKAYIIYLWRAFLEIMHNDLDGIFCISEIN